MLKTLPGITTSVPQECIWRGDKHPAPTTRRSGVRSSTGSRGRTCKQILNERLVALASFNSHRTLARLAESVAECEPEVDMRDHVWARQPPAVNVAGFTARRGLRDAPQPTGVKIPSANLRR
jgi:hypothetical protein